MGTTRGWWSALQGLAPTYAKRFDLMAAFEHDAHRAALYDHRTSAAGDTTGLVTAVSAQPLTCVGGHS